MRRNVLIILGALALAWGVLAIVLGAADLKLGSGSQSASSLSPACLPSSLSHTAALAGTNLDVSPAPDTDSADPHTQISFLGAPAAQIRDVTVVGRRSGGHSGQPARLLAGRRRELRCQTSRSPAASASTCAR